MYMAGCCIFVCFFSCCVNIGGELQGELQGRERRWETNKMYCMNPCISTCGTPCKAATTGFPCDSSDLVMRAAVSNWDSNRSNGEGNAGSNLI